MNWIAFFPAKYNVENDFNRSMDQETLTLRNSGNRLKTKTNKPTTTKKKKESSDLMEIYESLTPYWGMMGI